MEKRDYLGVRATGESLQHIHTDISIMNDSYLALVLLKISRQAACGQEQVFSTNKYGYRRSRL